MDGVQANIRTFITSPSGPGRLAPAFLEDLVLYDPQKKTHENRNVLKDGPFPYIDGTTLQTQLPPNSCQHIFWLKPKQSSPPDLDQRPESDTVWTVAAVCQKCRIHVELKTNFSLRWAPSPCPNGDRPVHHLVRSKWNEDLESSEWNRRHPDGMADISVFECSSEGCSAIVTVTYTPPILSDKYIEILTDKDQLQERTNAAFELCKDNTEGMRQPSSLDVLSDLRVYIKNAWEENPNRKSIKLSNRRFMVRFGPRGEACREVLEGLKFRFDEDEEICYVPTPNVADRVPLKDAVNIFLDNVEYELLALMLQRPQNELQLHPDLPQPSLAYPEFERTLSSQNYDKDPSSRATRLDQSRGLKRTAPFNDLGCSEDVADQLIIIAYHLQTHFYPPRIPDYLTALTKIALLRRSEALQTEVSLEKSKGRFDQEQLIQAYRDLSLNIETSLQDEDILGFFESRLLDMPAHQFQLRQSLRIVGLHRGSQKIIAVAENPISTYEQALEFFEADAQTSDEFLQSLFTAKKEEGCDEEQAVKAIQIIARERNSILLGNWINSGFVNNQEMDPAEAYRILGIDDRTIDDDLIITGYDVTVDENPANLDFYNRALETIAKERESTTLSDHLYRRAPQSQHGTSEQPVGLDNIGNTCYLNSLLQFLFTMVELRQIVLNFDEYRMDISDTTMLRKKVGQRKVTKKEVQTAQKFINSLAALFKGMIETPETAIRPEKELARLTLETDSAKEKIRRRSTLMSERPSLGHIDSQSFIGPLLPDVQPNGDLTDMAVQSPMEGDVPSNKLDEIMETDENRKNAEIASKPDSSFQDNSSEATLVSRTASIDTPVQEMPTVENQQAILDDKENLAPTKEESLQVNTNVDGADPLAPASPSKINAQAGALAQKAEGAIKTETQYAPPAGPPPVKYAPPPGKPPPVPPRKPVEPTTDILEEYARQQDVTEVIAHCLFQFSCAMRPLDTDEKSGEQLDEVHNTFFGQTVSHTVPEKEAPVPVQFLNTITRVANEPSDVYAALDTEYDLSVRDNGSKAFLSISNLPPVFSIALDRVVWDKQANRPAKLNHHVQVPETIFLDRYLEDGNDSDLMQRRAQTWELKRELSTLNERRKELETRHGTAPDLPSLFAATKDILEHLDNSFPGNDEDEDPLLASLGISPTTIDTISTIATTLREELNSITTRITSLQQQIRESFADMRKHPYRLHAAFFHRGGASGGHYWVYIYDHKKEIWRKYNDDHVKVVDNLNEIFGEPKQEGNTWNVPANPYFLVYVQEDKIDKIVETVKREIVWPVVEAETEPPALPPRNQMSEMPPDMFAHHGHGHGYGQQQAEVEMVEYVNGEQNANSLQIVQDHEPMVEKDGNWDDSELMVGGSRKW